MWRDILVNNAEKHATRFNNPSVFQTFLVNNREFEDPLEYLPIREYCETRFARTISNIGIPEVVRIFNNGLVGARANVTFSTETRVLAFLVGLRETGMSVIRARPTHAEDRQQFDLRGIVYRRNFHGSGLDMMHQPYLQHRVSQYLTRGGRQRIFIDDPTSGNVRNIGIRQREMHAVFAAYFRDQAEFYLSDELTAISDRLMRYFWRALTFGGLGGSPWPGSRSGGRNSLLSLCQLLNVSVDQIPLLWDQNYLSQRVDGISDLGLLKDLAREHNSRLHRNDTDYWRAEAKRVLREGLEVTRYYQAMKMAAIAESFSYLLEHNFMQQTQP